MFKARYLVLVGIILAAAALRLAPHPPNFTPIAALALFGGAHFSDRRAALGVPLRGQMLRHLLPNLMGPIVVYATLAVPVAILSGSFLSFLGIGVRGPLPSWGNLAADGLNELNTVRVRWWLLLWPCLLIGITLLALNFAGEGLREAFDPRRSSRAIATKDKPGPPVEKGAPRAAAIQSIPDA